MGDEAVVASRELKPIAVLAAVPWFATAFIWMLFTYGKPSPEKLELVRTIMTSPILVIGTSANTLIFFTLLLLATIFLLVGAVICRDPALLVIAVLVHGVTTFCSTVVLLYQYVGGMGT